MRRFDDSDIDFRDYDLNVEVEWLYYYTKLYKIYKTTRETVLNCNNITLKTTSSGSLDYVENESRGDDSTTKTPTRRYIGYKLFPY